MKKQFLGNCVNNPFNDAEALSGIVANAEDITQEIFLRDCRINPKLRESMKKNHWLL